MRSLEVFFVQIFKGWVSQSVMYLGLSNHFIYVVPKDMVKPTEIPEYAGLIYVEGDNIEIIKKAPKLHNFKANETLIRTVCSLLSTRTLFEGCSYIKFLNGKH